MYVEHLGSKTAVQIRSHAQKVFTKLELEREKGMLPEESECGSPGKHALGSRLNIIPVIHHWLSLGL